MSELEYSGSDGCPLHAAVIGSRSSAPPLVLLHGGGPDHRMFLPLAHQLSDVRTVVLPDVRGYGRSLCSDPALHTWSRYADDVVSLLDHLGAPRAVLGGAGLGTTISLRTAVAHPNRLEAAILISVEDIEDDERKAAEIEFMDAFAARVREHGIEAGWEPILPELAPLIGSLVREAIPRSDQASVTAAAAIGRDRSFRSVDELSAITVPVLIFGGMDHRHPMRIAEEVARMLPRATLSGVQLDEHVRNAEDLARVFAPEIRAFLRRIES